MSIHFIYKEFFMLLLLATVVLTVACDEPSTNQPDFGVTPSPNRPDYRITSKINDSVKSKQDASTELCGNGVLDLEEDCDILIPEGKQGACPQFCNDHSIATKDTLHESGTCKAYCSYKVITECENSDGYCPVGCTRLNDVDCKKHLVYSVGYHHTCAIKVDGTLWCWGRKDPDSTLTKENEKTQPTQIGTAKDWAFVGTGHRHTCAIKLDGSLWCWGRIPINQKGEPWNVRTKYSTPHRVGNDTWSYISGGDDFACGLKSDNTVWCWGTSRFGSNIPITKISSNSKWRSTHSGCGRNIADCALWADGFRYCWRYNEDYIGSFDVTQFDMKQPRNPYRWNWLALGFQTDCGIRDDQSLWCTDPDTEEWVRMDSSTNWVTVSIRGDHACGVKTDGSLWCWGRSDLGQAGVNAKMIVHPQELLKEQHWLSVEVGGDHTCGLDSKGDLWCWGSNNYGNLGQKSVGRERNPTQISNHAKWKQVVLRKGGGARSGHSCGIQTNGTLWCWGSNNLGQLGIGTTVSQQIPIQVGSGTDWKTLSLGAYHTCGLNYNGNLLCWGSNNYGACGTGRKIDETLPAIVDKESTWSDVTTGPYHTCGIKTDGSFWCWGDDGVGYVGTGDQKTPFILPALVDNSKKWISVAAGMSISCGLTLEGEVWCRGKLGDKCANSRVDQLHLIPLTKKLKKITAVESYRSKICGQDQNEKQSCWHICPFPSQEEEEINNQNPVQISFSGNFMDYRRCLVRSDSSLWCNYPATPVSKANAYGFEHWDRSFFYKVGDGFTSVSASLESTCAIKEDQSLWCFGENTCGQLGDGEAWSVKPARVTFNKVH